MPYFIGLSLQRLQAVGILQDLRFIVASLFLAAFLGAYVHFLPLHKKLWTKTKYVMPAGPRGWPIVGSLIPWLRARKGGTMVPWVRMILPHPQFRSSKLTSQTANRTIQTRRNDNPLYGLQNLGPPQHPSSSQRDPLQASISHP